ncbi:hypothetical protein RPMA_09570 [Tardiphaga alba]|uniref:DNA-binding protein n=1 Tax=Tardiphaga alba TaxID=340268 RepID=A0ABX8A5P4_9BRAD|nr:hypothetical protein [Tardiphaga alba]QUS39053.1 hypothetical protein RPMA_09570 [Tardiphaga alba]
MADPITIDELNLSVELVKGASNIAAIIGCCTDHVYDLAKRSDVPIYKPPGSGRYVAYRSELMRWTRTKTAVT